ncbi:DegV family protein [Cellulomonas hominis]
MAVVTDSTACLTPQDAARWGIDVVPLDVIVAGERHREGIDLQAGDLARALSAGRRVTTSQPSPAAFAEAYARAAAGGATEIVSIHLSGDLSGTVRAAGLAAQTAPVAVHVVDSRSVALGLGFAVLSAARLARCDIPVRSGGGARAGETAAARAGSVRSGNGGWPGPARVRAVAGWIAQRALRLRGSAAADADGDAEGGAGAGLEVGSDRAAVGSADGSATRDDARPAGVGRRLSGARRSAGNSRSAEADRVPEWPDARTVAHRARTVGENASAWFLVDSVDHLRRGGRLSATAAAFGTVLGLRPVLGLHDGRIEVEEKVRTRAAARARLEHLALAELTRRGGGRLGVHHLGQPDLAREVADRLQAAAGDELADVAVREVGSVVGAHVGPGVLAVVVADD